MLCTFMLVLGILTANAHAGTEVVHQDWKTLKLGGDPPLASTESKATVLPTAEVVRGGAMLTVQCDVDGTVRIQVYDAALALSYPSATSVLRFDEGEWRQGANARGDVADAELTNLMSHGVMQMKWTLPEGPLVAVFSLQGSRAAITAATAACGAGPVAAPAPSPTTK